MTRSAPDPTHTAATDVVALLARVGEPVADLVDTIDAPRGTAAISVLVPSGEPPSP
jgi:hypothetical protein